jgi:Meckel syndrome type 1 protein
VTAGKATASADAAVAVAAPHAGHSQDDSAANQPAAAQTADNGAGAAQAVAASAAPTASAAAATAPPLPAAHGAQITAQIAAQVVARAGATRTSFDFALEPQGLGRVDVSLKIDQTGQLSAVLSFDNPGAAAEAKARAPELQQALQQAGVNVAQDGLSFTSGGGQGAGAGWQGPQASYSQAAAANTPDVAADATAITASAASAGGVDITI